MSSSFTAQSDRQPLINSEERTRTNIATKQFIANNAGLLLVILSELFFSIMNAAAKLLRTGDPPMSTLQVILVRMGITCICSLIYIPFTDVGGSILGPKGLRLLLVFRGFTGFVAVFGVYCSLQYLSLPDATVLFFLTPLCTAIAGSLFLKESIGVSHLFAGVVSLVGVILIARPPYLFGSDETLHLSSDILELISVTDSMERMIAVGAALIGVLGITGGFISVRAIGKEIHPLIVMTHFAFDGLLLSLAGMIVTGTPFIIPLPLDWLILLLIGIFSFVAQTILTIALRMETAGRASLGLYTQIIFATILEQVLFHTSPSWLSILGTILILLSAIYITMTKKSITHDHESRRHPTSNDGDCGSELEVGFYDSELCTRSDNVASHTKPSTGYGATSM